MQSPYEILNVPRDASQSQIRQAYQSWAKLVHPDLVSEELKEFATGLMQQVNAAYQELTTSKGNKSATAQRLTEDYITFLSENIATESGPGQKTQITLPYWSLPATVDACEQTGSGPYLNLYIAQDRRGATVVSDDSKNLAVIKNYGYPSDLEAARNYLADINPITERNGVIQVRTQDCDSLGEAIHLMVEAISRLDIDFDERIHQWFRAKDFTSQGDTVALISAELSRNDYENEYVYQSDIFLLQPGQKLHLMMIPDPFWAAGEVKLQRSNEAMFANESTVFHSEGFLTYQEELTAKEESWYVPEAGVGYRITISGVGSFILAAYRAWR